MYNNYIINYKLFLITLLYFDQYATVGVYFEKYHFSFRLCRYDYTSKVEICVYN